MNLHHNSIFISFIFTTTFNGWKHSSSTLKSFLKVLNPTEIMKILENE
jgi:hypothetical protein